MTRLIDTVFPRLVAAAAIVALQPLAGAAASVEGSVTLNGQTVRITHVAAQLHDNAEGVFDRPLVLVFADRPVPAGALDGGMALGVHKLAREGQLRGLMLRIDPGKPSEASMVLLDKPADARTSLAFVSVSGSEGPVIAGLKLDGAAVSGSLKRAASGEPPASLGYTLRFDAPLQREPAPTADLQAAALKASPQYKAAAAYAEAMAKGDLKAVRLAASPAMLEQIDGMVAAAGEAAAIERMKKGGVSARAQLAKFKRMVERGNRAMLVVDNYEYLTLVKEGADWKMGS
ncbi:MAG: hypothetical protein K8R60_08280 [Burkholderiales bacterium]|nr:hypothetical protein [Burkholderiales bacterium]